MITAFNFPTDFLTSGPTWCPVRICTGEACPGCGMTRAFGSLLQGDVGEAMKFHPLAIVIALQVAVLLTVMGTRSTGLFGLRPLAKANHDLWLLRIGVLNFVAFVGVWAARWKLGLLEVVV